MSRFIVLILTALCLTTSLQAQQLMPLNEAAYLKQLNSNLAPGMPDSTHLHNYLLLSEYWAQRDSLKSKQALQLVLQSPQQQLLPPGLLAYYQGIAAAGRGDKYTALKALTTAIGHLEKLPKHSDLLMRAYYQQAYIQVENKGYDFIVKTLTEKCIPLAEKSKDSLFAAYCYTQLGLTLMSVGQFEKAETYHMKALKLSEANNTARPAQLLTYFNLVSNYCYKADSKSAKVYLDKAKNLIQPYPNSQHYPNYYYQEAMYHTTRQEDDLAVLSLQKGIALAKQKNQAKLLQLLYFRMYNVYLMRKDYPRAKAQLEQILQENILNREAVNRKITYTQLATVNDVLGNHQEAYTWMKKSSLLSDSLQQHKLMETIHELEIAHQTSEKQQKINRLEQEKKENALIAKNKNLRISILGAALILSLVITFLVYRTYRKQQQLNEQIRINHQRDLLHLESQRNYEATRAVLQGEEQERQRIAQDLHDSMGGMLANIRMSISAAATTFPNTGLPPSTDLLAKIDKSIAEMRRISRNLMPETLKNIGLEIALQELCESMAFPQLSIQFEAFNLSPDISFQTQLALYRVTQESISNVIKYAQACNVIVQISQQQEELSLTIEDDGIGFDPGTTKYGMGLKNIQNRIQLIQGTVEIMSAPGEGTTININCHV